MRADDAARPYLNDYPKMGAWHDGIYMTANMFDCLTATCSSASYKGVRVWALDRDDLINGNPLTFQYGDLGTAYFSLLPANAKVDMPPTGTPNYMMSLQTSTTMNTWKFDIDWVTPANTTFTGPFTTGIAGYSNVGTVPQAGTGTRLDSLSGRLMAQLQYSDVGGNPALWVTHSVTSGGVAGLRWYEFRNLAGTPSVFQQSTYQPDSTYRWMGSVAVDQDGNMAIGYSASNSSINPQIRYAGRLSSDPLNTLGQGEATLIAGTGSQTSYSRWGDYSALSVDPDGCTFWYTTEYYAATGTNWQTRIGSFAMPNCGSTGGGDLYYLSVSANGHVPGLDFRDEDIVSFDPGSSTWAMVFDASDVGVTVDLNAFDIMDDGTILMSFEVPSTIGSLGMVDDSDIVRFIPTTLGDNTTGTFELYFDGSDVNLETTGEDIDAIGFAPDGRLILSVLGNFNLSPGRGTDEDLIAFSPTSLGTNTAGTWAIYFDGSDVELNNSSGEDVNGVWIDNGTNDLYLTTNNIFSVTGASGVGTDIFICSPGSLGGATTCTYSTFWNAQAAGLNSNISVDGFDIAP